jgi:hypothetical protein
MYLLFRFFRWLSKVQEDLEQGDHERNIYEASCRLSDRAARESEYERERVQRATVRDPANFN